jgi:ferrous iron transport protein A
MNKAVSLADLAVGEHAILSKLTAGRTVINRLASLGFTPGAEVEVTQNHGRGPLIVILRGARIALGRLEASQVFVERNPG